MKGLFYKEARSLWHFGKTYLLMLVIFLGLALYQSTDSSGGAVWMLYPIFFAGTLPASLIGDDEKSGWLTYCDILPVTRRQIVTVKYITCLVTAAAVCLLAVPVVLLILLLFVADYLLSTKVVRGRFRQVALALALSPLLLVGIELAVNQFLKGAWQLTWSLIVSVPCLILALLVLVLDRRQRFKEEMRKRLHM